MLLWSYQNHNFSLTEGKVDHSRSEFYNSSAAFKTAYVELHKRLKTQQVVWCCTKSEFELWKGRIEWQLDVPFDKFLAVVDQLAWNKILGKKCSPPTLQRHRWQKEAIALAPNNSKKQQEIYAANYAEYDKPEPLVTLWNRLFISNVNDESANILLTHPISSGWVLATRLCKT